MGPTLEAIKGGGGSIKVGTTGTIGTLMSRELESTKTVSTNTYPTASALVPSGATTPRRLKTRTSADEASSSNNYNTTNHKIPEITRKTKHCTRKTHQIPMLNSENISLDRTPSREKSEKRGSYLVEIVDIKCGTPDKTWANPITNRLKKLGFSKLSESIV